MSDELVDQPSAAISAAEVIPTPAVEVVEGRNAKGQFLPGYHIARKATANKLTTALRQAALEEIESKGREGNPLLLLYRLGVESTSEKIRVDALTKLATLVFGVKSTVEVESPDAADEATIAKTRRLFATLFISETETVTS